MRNIQSQRYSKLIRNYNHLYNRIHKWLSSGRFYQFSKQRQLKLLARLHRYARRLAIPVTGLFLSMYPQAALAQPMGTEFRINSFTTTPQEAPAAAVNQMGQTVVVYQSEVLDGDGFGIYGKRYNGIGEQLGIEFRINEYITGDQADPAVAMDMAGNFVVVWEGENQAGSGTSIYSRQYDSDGNPLGGEFPVSPPSAFDLSTDPDVAMDDDGDFVVVWKAGVGGDFVDIKGQRYNSAGATQGAVFTPNTFTTGFQTNPSVAMDSQGNFVTTWVSIGNQDGDRSGIFGQRFTANGTPQGSEFQANTYTTHYQLAPAVAMSKDGDFVVVWESNGQDASGYGIYGQRYNSDGVAEGGEISINSYKDSHQKAPSVGLNAKNDFIVTWQGLNHDGSSYGVFAKRFNANGNPEKGEFRINSFTTNRQQAPAIAVGGGDSFDFIVAWEGEGASDPDGVFAQRYFDGTGPETTVNTFKTGLQIRADVATDDNGNYVVVWESDGKDGSEEGIYGQRFTNDGNPLDNEFQINTFTLGRQEWPSVAMDANGNFVVVWQSYQDGSGAGIFGQRFATNGSPRGGEFPINTFTTSRQSSPDVAMSAEGDFVVVWNSYGQVGGVYGQRFEANGDALGIEFQVPTTTLGRQAFPSAGMDANGNFVITWSDYGNDINTNVFAQRFAANGSKVGIEFTVNTYTSFNQSSSSVAMDASGNFVVVWHSDQQDGDQLGIFGQSFLADGNMLAQEFQVNTSTLAQQRTPSVAVNDATGFVVTWYEVDFPGGFDPPIYSGIFAQRYNLDGSRLGGEFRVNTFTGGAPRFPVVAMDDNGNFLVAWENEFPYDSGDSEIKSQRYTHFPYPCTTQPFMLVGLEDNTKIYRTQSIISSVQEIEISANVTYQAGTSILLQEGFIVKPGGRFIARIESNCLGLPISPEGQ